MNKLQDLRVGFIAVIIIGLGLTGFTRSSLNESFKVRTDKSTVKWKAYKTGGEHHGTVEIKSGEFVLSGVLLNSGNFVIDMTSIKVSDTESQKLHNHLHSMDFFNTASFPEAKLSITGSKKVDDKTVQVTGNMTIVGQTHPITFDASIAAHTSDVIIYDALLKVDRTKYGITYRSSLGDAFINDEFDLNVKLVGVREKS